MSNPDARGWVGFLGGAVLAGLALQCSDSGGAAPHDAGSGGVAIGSGGIGGAAAAGRAESGGASSGASAGGQMATGTASFTELKALFTARCVRCHSGSSTALIDLRDDAELYERLTTPLTTASCRGRTLVVPSSLSESLLHLKVQPRPPCGSRMPSECAGQSCLGAADVQTIVNYIASGAPE